MRKILTFLATIIFAASLISVPANAVSNPSLGDNPESPQSIDIRRKITNVSEPVTNRFDYEIFDAENSGLIQHITEDIYLDFHEAEPDEDGAVELVDSFDLSDMTFFGLGGIRLLGLREVKSSNPEDYPVSDQVYYFKVAMKGEVDEYGWQTGNFTPTLILPFEDEAGAKYDVAEFSESFLRTHIELQAPSVGDGIKESDVFRYEVTIFGDDGETYDIIAPKGDYEFEDKNVKSDKKCHAGEVCVVYLAPGEFATIGLSADGDDQIRNSTHYQIKMTVSQKEVIIDGETTPEPEPINIKPDTIKTGIEVSIIPFAFLALMAILGIAIVCKSPK
ncbi:hypothetical protein IJ847_02655 [Candidatus Saccharibacteria bacterium]|nr:hypothetical protein [Candidatus Saccharibacteria bacterium]